jgi:hypothetical protein
LQNFHATVFVSDGDLAFAVAARMVPLFLFGEDHGKAEHQGTEDEAREAVDDSKPELDCFGVVVCVQLTRSSQDPALEG